MKKLFIFYGPSGTGKTFWKEYLTGELKLIQLSKIVQSYPKNLWKEIWKNIFLITNIFTKKHKPFNKVVTTTTRPPRQGEINSIHYNFLSRDEFLSIKEKGEFIEVTENFGHLYGCSRKNVEDALLENNAVIVLDNNGVKKIKETYGRQAVAVYFKIDEEEMKKRLLQRGETAENIEKRLTSLKDKNHQEAGLSDYIIDTSSRIDYILMQLLDVINKECGQTNIIQRKTAVFPEFVPKVDTKNIPPLSFMKKRKLQI